MSKQTATKTAIAPRYHLPDEFFGNSPGLLTVSSRTDLTIDLNPLPPLALNRLLEEAKEECGRATPEGFVALMDAGGIYIPIDSKANTIGPARGKLLGRSAEFLCGLGRLMIRFQGEDRCRGGDNFYLVSTTQSQVAAMMGYSDFARRAGAELLAAGFADPDTYSGPPGDLWAGVLFSGLTRNWTTSAGGGARVIKEPWSTTLRVLRALVPEPVKVATHSPDFASVNWFGTPHTFTKNQRKIVCELWSASEAGSADVGADYLLVAADVAKGTKMSVVFRDNPAWGTMIVNGSQKDTYRLKTPQM
jgi:hypothetical protein